MTRVRRPHDRELDELQRLAAHRRADIEQQRQGILPLMVDRARIHAGQRDLAHAGQELQLAPCRQNRRRRIPRRHQRRAAVALHELQRHDQRRVALAAQRFLWLVVEPDDFAGVHDVDALGIVGNPFEDVLDARRIADQHAVDVGVQRDIGHPLHHRYRRMLSAHRIHRNRLHLCGAYGARLWGFKWTGRPLVAEMAILPEDQGKGESEAIFFLITPAGVAATPATVGATD